MSVGLSSAKAQCIPAEVSPKLAVGFEWSIRIEGGPTEINRVVNIKEGEMTVSVTGNGQSRTDIYTTSWGILRGVTANNKSINYRPALPIVTFPMKNGTEWNQTVSYDVDSSSAQFQFGGRTVGVEIIKVDGKDICATKIDISSRGAKAASCYYAEVEPGVGFLARCEGSTTRSIRNFETVSFSR